MEDWQQRTQLLLGDEKRGLALVKGEAFAELFTRILGEEESEQDDEDSHKDN